MNPLYSKLLKYVPPPTKPEDIGTLADWDRVEKRIGVSFPDDYRWIMDTYGYDQYEVQIVDPSHGVQGTSAKSQITSAWPYLVNSPTNAYPNESKATGQWNQLDITFYPAYFTQAGGLHPDYPALLWTQLNGNDVFKGALVGANGVPLIGTGSKGALGRTCLFAKPLG